MERIGIYGGTFNPTEAGQIRDAAEAVDRLKLDRLILLPIVQEKEPGDPDAEQFNRMLALAAGEIPHCEAADGISAECAEQNVLKILDCVKEQSGREPVLLIDAADAQKYHLQGLSATMEVLDDASREIPPVQIRRLRDFGCAESITTEKIAAYIRENHLYGFSDVYRNLPMEKLEKVVISLLNPNRINHVLGCRDTAVKLAEKWGADITDASRAGILHDITKALDGPLQLTLCREYGILLNDFSAKNPKTLHALTGSFVAQNVFGESETVVSAIRNHTTGKADMRLLDKIVYIADYMEPSRDFPGVQKLRDLAFADLDAAFKLGLEMTIDLLKRQKREISSESLEALAWMNQHQ